MNSVVQEMLAVLNGDPPPGNYLMHYGVKRRSGRYPWGSGENPYQHSGDWLSRVQELRKEGFTYTDENGKVYKGDTAIAKSMNMSTTEFRAAYTIAKNERRSLLVDRAKALRDKGMTPTEIAKEMGYANESSVRALLNEKSEASMNSAKAVHDILKEKLDNSSHGMLDVGSATELSLGVSREKMEVALTMLEMEGYEIYGAGIPNITNKGKQTNMMVLCKPGTEYKEVYNFENVDSIDDYVSHDGGDTFDKRWVYPESMDSSRLMIRYSEEGGLEKDGLVEIRRNVDDLSLGESTYAQVRILVDGDHYIKGMAVYSDGSDMPDGVDVIFNTNKTVGTPVNKVLKEIKADPENPFGSLIKDGIVDPDDPDNTANGGQSYYYDSNGNKKLSLINKRAEEGDWGKWADTIPSQFLAKQKLSLAKQQLKLTLDDKQDEFDSIMELTNPTVKKVLLDSFASDCDASAVHLKAAALPRQKYQVIIPLTTIKDDEVYAPQYENGEKVALIRYPHGGTFEIPILTVNNKSAEGKKYLGDAADAVGITKAVADRLSGADFDGDTVMVIPTAGNGKNSKVKITSTKPLKDLEGFDTKVSYGPDSSDPVKVTKNGTEYYTRDGHTYARMRDTQKQMGVVSNLITDMTIKGADTSELARAVKHSMVVIDAEKHKLDWKQSEKDNGIAELKAKYQGHYDDDGNYHEGASTLLSRAKSQQQVLKQRGQVHINQIGKSWYDSSKPEGALIYNRVEETYTDKKGKTKVRTETSTKMAETDDATTLISEYNSSIEQLYANYANKCKSLANEARKAKVYTENLKTNATAKAVYKNEVQSLKDKVAVSAKNAPRERQAQMLANSVMKAMKQDNPSMTKEEIKKAETRELNKARAKVGAKRTAVTVTDKEWEAIQSGAVSENLLNQVLKYADKDDIKQRATPRSSTELRTSQKNKIKRMKALGYTTAQIANAVGCSTSTVQKYS